MPQPDCLKGFTPGKDDHAAYGLSKAALTVYTMNLAKKLRAEGTAVKANCLSPGLEVRS